MLDLLLIQVEWWPIRYEIRNTSYEELPQPFTALFPGRPGSAVARREPLD